MKSIGALINERYKKQYPDWKFFQKEGRWKVVVAGEAKESWRERHVERLSAETAKRIQETCGVYGEGELYVKMPNFYESGEDNLHLYVGFPGDCIRAIREGKGDCMNIQNVFGPAHQVFFFLNREFGEKVRQTAVEGFKDAEFKYIIQLNINEGFGVTYNMGAEDKAYHTVWFADKKPAYFDTMEEAQGYIKLLEKEVQEMVDSFETYEMFIEWLEKHFKDRTIQVEAINAEAGLKFSTSASDEKPKHMAYFHVAQEMVREEKL